MKPWKNKKSFLSDVEITGPADMVKFVIRSVDTNIVLWKAIEDAIQGLENDARVSEVIKVLIDAQNKWGKV